MFLLFLFVAQELRYNQFLPLTIEIVKTHYVNCISTSRSISQVIQKYKQEIIHSLYFLSCLFLFSCPSLLFTHIPSSVPHVLISTGPLHGLSSAPRVFLNLVVILILVASGSASFSSTSRLMTWSFPKVLFTLITSPWYVSGSFSNPKISSSFSSSLFSPHFSSFFDPVDVAHLSMSFSSLSSSLLLSIGKAMKTVLLIPILPYFMIFYFLWHMS